MILSDHPFSAYAKFPKKQTFLTPGYAHIPVCIRGWELLVFLNILRTYSVDNPLWVGISLSVKFHLGGLQLFKTELLHRCFLWLLWIFKNNYFVEHLQTVASEKQMNYRFIIKIGVTENPLQSFYKIGILKNFAKLTRRHLCWSLFFDKSSGLQSATLFNKRLQRRWFAVNFAKNFKKYIFNKTPETHTIHAKISTHATHVFVFCCFFFLFWLCAKILWTPAIQTKIWPAQPTLPVLFN